jgi:hypothetical protein
MEKGCGYSSFNYTKTAYLKFRVDLVIDGEVIVSDMEMKRYITENRISQFRCRNCKFALDMMLKFDDECRLRTKKDGIPDITWKVVAGVQGAPGDAGAFLCGTDSFKLTPYLWVIANGRRGCPLPKRIDGGFDGVLMPEGWRQVLGGRDLLGGGDRKQHKGKPVELNSLDRMAPTKVRKVV